jgi:hypothetical protein
MGIQQMLLGEGGFNGVPQNQSGGGNNVWNPDGTNGALDSGYSAMTPINWFTIFPQAGVGAGFTFTATDTGGSGATGITNNGVTLPLSSSQGPAAMGGAGHRTFSYLIKNLAGTTVASGNSTTDNTI